MYHCSHSNQKQFPAETNIHLPGIEMLDKPTVWVFPQLVICMECGLTQFVVAPRELAQLRDSLTQSKATAAYETGVNLKREELHDTLRKLMS